MTFGYPPGGGGTAGALPGTAAPVPALARAAGRAGAPGPPLCNTTGMDRPMGGRPPGGAGAGGARCAPANAEAPVTADDDGANSTDISPERAMPGTGAGTVTGPAAGSG